MARSALNRKITSSVPYAVPAGKLAIVKAYLVKSGSTTSERAAIFVNGMQIALLYQQTSTSSGNTAQVQAGPIVLGPGDVISTQAAGTSDYEFGISGILYDN